MVFLSLFILLSAAACLLLFGAAYLCFRLTFRAFRRVRSHDPYDLPPGRVYEPFYPLMRTWIDQARSTPGQDFTITSFDGLKLHARYYEYACGAPIELMFHGYRGTAERDFCGGVQRGFAMEHSVFLVDQRTSGASEGSVITFGIRESRDCLSWIEFIIRRFGPDVKIILTGISMGASTVLIAAGHSLPENVVCVLADCGYTSARDIIRTVIARLRLPPALLYPLIRLGARTFGHFDPEENSPLQAMAHCTLPVLFIHGESDTFVPCEMSRRNYEACTAPKRLFTVPGADHGLSYPTDTGAYLSVLREFSAVSPDQTPP